MREIVNRDPGLVENDASATSCFLACSQMVLRTRAGSSVPSFQELAKIIHKEPGKYSWEYALLSYFSNEGFDVKFISTFDLARFVDEGDSYMYKYFGAEAAEDQIRNSNMDQARVDAKDFLSTTGVEIDVRVPQREDVESLIADGFYLVPYVNQKIFQAELGYVAHTVLVYGISERGVRMHNPGPPATAATEVAWDLFVNAWSSPNESSRILFAVRPPRA